MIIKIPRINALGNKGPEKAGNFILQELKKIYPGFGKLDLEEIHVDNSNVEEAEELIYKNCKKEFEKLGEKDFRIFLGGDHSISYPCFKAFKEEFENCFLIVFDAHADCMGFLKEPTHEEWLRGVVEKCGLTGSEVVLIGLRKVESEEKRFLQEKGIKYFSGEEDLGEIADYVEGKSFGKDIYVSIDVDVLDPAFAPAVNYPEQDGLSSKDFFYLLEKIFSLSKLKALDIVEIVPEKDKLSDLKTIKLGAEILKRFLEKKNK